MSTKVLSIQPHRAVKYKESSIEKALSAAGSLIAQIKYDGVRSPIIIKPLPTDNYQPLASAEVFSREGRYLRSFREFDRLKRERFGRFLSESLYRQGMIIDCEAMVKGMTFEESSGRIRTNKALDDSEVMFVVYGVLPIEALNDPSADVEVTYGVMQMQIELLVHQLKQHFPEIDFRLAETYDVFSMPALHSLYEEKRAEGHEGLVAKDPLSLYRRGKKTGIWKLKPEDEADGVVQAPIWGTEGKANEGKVIGFEVLLENGTVVNACGLTQERMAEFTKNVNAEPTYYNGWQVQVKFMERTSGGSLRHPNFDRWRGTESDPYTKS